MKLPSFKLLNTKDYQDQFKNLVGQLSLSLNYGIQVIYEAINGQLTLRDNIKCTIKDLTFSVDSTGSPNQTVLFTLNQPGKVDGVLVLNATNQSNPNHIPSNQPFISWSQNNTTITVDQVTGLQTNETYVLRIVAYQQ